MNYCRIKLVASFCALFSLILLAGCSPTKTVFFKQPESKAQNYHVVEIPDFTKTELEWVPYDSNIEIPNMLAEKLRTANGFDEIARDASAVDKSESGVLVVQGEVIHYNRGCKFCEWLLRVNDKGKSSITVRVQLLDKTTGNVLADTSIEGRAKSPGYGKYRYVRVVDEMARLIESVNERKSYSQK
ncbi:MAG: hypothetical protein ACT4NX_06440 [Deltaproteobacteria bacterium]